MTDTQRPWDRLLTTESDPAYEAFAAYLETGSLRDAYRQRSDPATKRQRPHRRILGAGDFAGCYGFAVVLPCGLTYRAARRPRSRVAEHHHRPACHTQRPVRDPRPRRHGTRAAPNSTRAPCAFTASSCAALVSASPGEPNR